MSSPRAGPGHGDNSRASETRVLLPHAFCLRLIGQKEKGQAYLLEHLVVGSGPYIELGRGEKAVNHQNWFQKARPLETELPVLSVGTEHSDHRILKRTLNVTDTLPLYLWGTSGKRRKEPREISPGTLALPEGQCLPACLAVAASGIGSGFKSRLFLLFSNYNGMAGWAETPDLGHPYFLWTKKLQGKMDLERDKRVHTQGARGRHSNQSRA